MQKNIQPISFNARIILKKSKTEIKPYVIIGGINNSSQNSSLLNKTKTRKPSWLIKFLFGIKKNTKLPSNKV